MTNTLKNLETRTEKAGRYALFALDVALLAGTSIVMASVSLTAPLALAGAALFFQLESRYGLTPRLADRKYNRLIAKQGLERVETISANDAVVLSQNDLDEIAEKLGLAQSPELHFQKAGAAPYAFCAANASRKRKKSLIAVNEALIKKLDREEILAVIAHEAVHLVRKDSVRQNWSFTKKSVHMIGVVSLAVNGYILPAAQATALFLSNFITTRMAERQREHLADRGAARLYPPEAMQTALEKSMSDAEKDLATMSEQRPLAKIISNVFNLCSTHPSTPQRIQSLQRRAATTGSGKPSKPGK